MITITDEASFEAAIANTTDAALRKLLAARLKLYRVGCLLDLTMLVVVQPGDTADDVERETGLNPLVNPIDGARHPAACFAPYWDYLELAGGWFEWICCAGDTGYATILLVPDTHRGDPELMAMLRAFAGEARRG